MEKSKRGGRRPGTGPKPKYGVKMVKVTFQVMPAAAEELKKAAKEKGVTLPQLIRERLGVEKSAWTVSELYEATKHWDDLKLSDKEKSKP